MNRFTTVFLLLMAFSKFTMAQNRFDLRGSDKETVATVNAWIGPVMKKEFPGDDTTYYMSPGTYTDYAIKNLLSDKYFVPVFGEPFDNMDPKTREKIGEALQDCINSKKLQGRYGWVSLVYRCFQKPYAEQYITGVKILRAERSRYEEELRKYADANSTMSQSEYQRSFPLLSRTYRNLLKNEVKELGNLMTAASGRGIAQARRSDVDAEMNRDGSVASAEKINAFLKKMANEQADPATAEMITPLKARLDGIVTNLMQAEEAKLQAIPAGDAGIDAGNTFYKNFLASYRNIMDNFAVKKISDHFIAERLRALELLKADIKSQFQQAANRAELDRLVTKYLSYPGYYIDGVKQELSLAALAKHEKLNADLKMQALAQREKAKEMARGKLRLAGKLLQFDSTAAWQGEYEDAYLRNFNGMDEEFEKEENTKFLLFRTLVDAISDEYPESLPATKKKYEIISRVFVRSDYQGFGGTRRDVYEDRVIKTIYMRPEYFETYTNLRLVGPAALADLGDIYQALVNPGRFANNMVDLAGLTNSISIGAKYLLKTNGVLHPGINKILDNLQYYIDAYGKPKEWPLPEGGFSETTYQYDSRKNYYRKVLKEANALEYNFVDAAPNFVPPVIYPPDSNFFSTSMIVYHAQKPSTGIIWLDFHTLNLFTLANGKFVNKASRENNLPPFNLPAQLITEYMDNNKYFYIVDIVYNQLKNGVMETKQTSNWYNNGRVPSAALQDALKEYIGKPVSAINPVYEVND